MGVKMRLTDKDRNTVGVLTSLFDEILSIKKSDKLKEIESLYAHSILQTDVNNYNPNETYLFNVSVTLINILPIYYSYLTKLSKEESLKKLNEVAETYRTNLKKELDNFIHKDN